MLFIVIDTSPRRQGAAASGGGEVGVLEGSTTSHNVHFPPSLQDSPVRHSSNQSIDSEGTQKSFC